MHGNFLYVQHDTDRHAIFTNLVHARNNLDVLIPRSNSYVKLNFVVDCLIIDLQRI